MQNIWVEYSEVLCSKHSSFHKNKEQMQRGKDNRKISHSFLYLIHKTDKNNARVWEANIHIHFPDFPIPLTLISPPPPLTPEFKTVNTCTNFVIKVCLPKPGISFVMGVCLSVKMRSAMEVVLGRGSQRQKLSSGGWLCHADRTSSIDGCLGNTVNTPSICLTLLVKPAVSFAGVLFSLVVVMYVIWVQAMADLENYTNMKKMDCSDFAVYVRYGWSFMLAPIGVFFSLLAGLLFLLVGRAIYLHSD